MRISFFLLFIIASQTLFSEVKKLTVANSEWFVVENSLSETYPVNNWQPKKFKTPMVVPLYNGAVPVLKNFEIQHRAFPNMLDIVIGPPAEGIYRSDEKELARYVEFINEKAFETDNNLEYLLPLEGQWGLKKEFQSKDYLFQFAVGAENWIEIIAGNQLLASGKGTLVTTGGIFPATGNVVIKVSAIDTNNKGLVDVKIYKVYEHLIVDPFHKAISEKWVEKSKDLAWLPPTDSAQKKSPWLPENTPALFKRTYTCNSLEATKNIYFSGIDSITHLWINGKQVDINDSRIPDNFFIIGDNEIIYYLSETKKGLSLDLEFFSVRPYWIKTELEASKDSVVTGLLRGANSKVYVNGHYAGVLGKEKYNEYLGYGLFKDGKNEIALCILQSDPKTFLEHLSVTKADKSKALVLPWEMNTKELSSSSPGILSQYDGFYLQWKPGLGNFSAEFNGKSEADLELIFNSGKRFPDWMFRKDLFIPKQISLNGKIIKRTGHSFVLPAEDLKTKNVIEFNHSAGALPEPLLYTSSEAKPDGFFRFKKVARYGREVLKPTLHFTGEKVTYLLDIDFSMFDKVLAEFGDQKFEFSPDSKQVLTLEIKEAGEQELKFTVTREGRSMTIPGDKFYCVEYPQNKEEWLSRNKEISEILISSDAFYNSESTLFPEFHQREWLIRELKTDSKHIEFGPLASYKSQEKFSIFDSFPNGVPVIEKFARRMETYMKLRSRGYPVQFIFEKQFKPEQFWSSAATMQQYLKWLEQDNVKVDWSLETLDEFQKKYVKDMPDKASDYVDYRVKSISSIIKKLALNAAPGSTFKEVTK